MNNRLLGIVGGAMVALSLSMAVFAFVWPGAAAGPGSPGMMGRGQSGQAGAPGSVSMNDAQKSAQAYVDRYGASSLKLAHIMEFQNNFYIVVGEKGTGRGAFELLVDRRTASVSREPGPDMMWNAKYGGMGGPGTGGPMMGGQSQGGEPMTVSADQAKKLGQSWLAANQPGNMLEEPTTFYGYYTFDFGRASKPVGMLSVNGYTGQVWYHTWHGAFVTEKDLGG
jgi:hypothetical protein